MSCRDYVYPVVKLVVINTEYLDKESNSAFILRCWVTEYCQQYFCSYHMSPATVKGAWVYM